MKAERVTVEEPLRGTGGSVRNMVDNKSIRRTTTVTVGLLSTIWLIDMVDRVMIGLALPMIGDEFSLSSTQLGGVVSVFAIFYMLGQVPGGMLADRFGPRPLLIVALILWSVFTALTGFAWGLISLMVMRAMFGISQGSFRRHRSRLWLSGRVRKPERPRWVSCSAPTTSAPASHR